MTRSELQQLVKNIYLERLALLLQRESAARFIADYDVNNAYQYVINREETHIAWLQQALLDLDLEIPPDPPRPDVRPSRKGDAAALAELAGNDARSNQEFVNKWRDRIEQITNARLQGTLRVMLGEMLEHERLFEQASQGRTDILGTALPINERRGKVIDTRWIE